MWLMFSEIYPGSIYDSNIAEQFDVISWVEKEHKIKSEKGFGIKDFL